LYRAVGCGELTRLGHLADVADSVSMAKDLAGSVS